LLNTNYPVINADGGDDSLYSRSEIPPQERIKEEAQHSIQHLNKGNCNDKQSI